jgi:hypothetical protein
MIQVVRFIVADNPDVLAGSDLDPIPGTVRAAIVYVASSQADTLITIQSPNQPVARQISPVLRANGVPDVASDPGIAIPLAIGGKLVIAVDIVTAATVGVVVQAG